MNQSPVQTRNNRKLIKKNNHQMKLHHNNKLHHNQQKNRNHARRGKMTLISEKSLDRVLLRKSTPPMGEGAISSCAHILAYQLCPS